MAYNNLCRKLEDALYGYLSAEASVGTAQIYRTMSQGDPGSEAVAPCVKIVCAASRPMSDAIDASSGCMVRYMSCALEVDTVADSELLDSAAIASARDAHDAIVGAVFDAITASGVPAALEAVGVANLSVMQVDLPTERFAVEGRRYRTTLEFDALCASKE
jgi:hypothetical protein